MCLPSLHQQQRQQTFPCNRLSYFAPFPPPWNVYEQTLIFHEIFCSKNRISSLLTFVAKRTQMAALTLIPPAYWGFVGGSTSFRRIETEKSRRRNHSPVCACVCGHEGFPFIDARSLFIQFYCLPAFIQLSPVGWKFIPPPSNCIIFYSLRLNCACEMPFYVALCAVILKFGEMNWNLD